MDNMQWIVFAVAAAIYIYRFISKTGAAAKEEAERRRKLNEDIGKTVKDNSAEKPKTLQEVLAEVFNEVETKTKPFAEPERNVRKKREVRPAMRTVLQSTLKQEERQKSVVKKEPVPFLTEDFTSETLEPEGTPSHLMDDYIRKSELTDGYMIEQAVPLLRKNFNLRDAVIANTILSRPEW